MLVCISALSAASSSIADQVRTILNKALEESGAPSISVAVVQDGKLVYAGAVGRASITPDRKATAETGYAVGSVSKQFTAAALLLAAEKGKLSLKDPVSKYFPGLTRSSEITIRELLSHTSGYEDYAPQDYIIPEWTKPISPDSILNRWAKKPLNFDPGTRWRYSNTNYVLAGRIFEKATNGQLMPFLQNRIFAPLEMQSAGDCSVSKSSDDAMAYTRYALGPPRPALREGPGWYFAAGELCVTPTDVAKWDVAVLSKKILSEASYREFTTEVRLKNGDATHYALGLTLTDVNGVPTFEHGGEVSGFLTENMVFPTRNAAVVVCSNQDGSQVIGSVSRQIARMLTSSDEKPATEKEIQQVTGILTELSRGNINRDLFTGNANFYFSPRALEDYRKSLEAVGKLQKVTRTRESLRGGMIHRSYRAEFEKKAVNLNVYVTPQGKYEQFLVVETF
jgi:CubicO group peptidase (beta-lactamase class C family)